jgi:hypothetical protein
MTEDYPFPEEETVLYPILNQKCMCSNRACPRHGNCKECQEFHGKRMETTFCGK